MRVFLLTLLLSFPALLPAETLLLTLYAVAAKDADRIPPEEADDPVKLAAFLEKLATAKRATVPLRISSPLTRDTPTTLTKGEALSYFQTFTESKGVVTGATETSRNIGYDLTWEPRGKSGEPVRFDLTFQWTPSFERVPIAGEKPVAWTPVFHAVSAEAACALARDMPILAATWQVRFPLSATDKAAPRQLYLIAMRTDSPPAE